MSRDMCALQVQQGADVLDINMDDGLIEGVAAMTKFVNLCISGGWMGPVALADVLWRPTCCALCCCGCIAVKSGT
jgi:cobalamin-dependent methionine synthase I